MTKAALLKELEGNTYVMIKPSPIEGIGVFAIRDIPKGCRTIFSDPAVEEDNWHKISRQEMELLPAHTKQLIETYCLYDTQNYFVPANGFKKMDLVLFLNHSEKANIISINEGQYFEATRDIAAGEELLVDYGELVDE